jgi:hypothetical protein
MAVSKRAKKSKDDGPKKAVGGGNSRPKSSTRLKLSKAITLLISVIGIGVIVIFTSYYSRSKKNFQASNEVPKDGDVMISSFPKSGSFWARFLVASVVSLVQRDSTSRVTFDTIETLIPDLELGPNRRLFSTLEPIYPPHFRLFKVS